MAQAMKKGGPLPSRPFLPRMLQDDGQRHCPGDSAVPSCETKKGDPLRSRPFHPQTLQDAHEIQPWIPAFAGITLRSPGELPDYLSSTVPPASSICFLSCSAS